MIKIKSCYLPKSINFVEGQISIGVVKNSSMPITIISIHPNHKGEIMYLDMHDKDAKLFADSIYKALEG